MAKTKENASSQLNRCRPMTSRCASVELYYKMKVERLVLLQF